MTEEEKGEILTADSVPAYLMKKLDSIPVDGWDANTLKDVSDITCKTIEGGNVNYAFYCKLNSDTNSSKIVFVKQAPEFVAVFGPGTVPLTSERMLKEKSVYETWKNILGVEKSKLYLPTIYFFDPIYMVICMEFFTGFELLDHVLVDENMKFQSKKISRGLGDFMGKTHAGTHSSIVDETTKNNYVKEYENRAMRDIQLEYVFTKAYREATDEQRCGLDVSEAFMKEIELLKNQYNGQTDSLVLSHGDLHPGSVMVSTTESDTSAVKVIDPEFTVYGPPGLDVGSLLSGYCLGVIHQYHSKKLDYSKQIINGIQDVWDAYVDAMKTGGITNKKLLKDIEIETIGFTVAEICRTALEFAGGRKWLQFEDATIKEAAKKDALQVVSKCMIARHENGIELLISSLQDIISK